MKDRRSVKVLQGAPMKGLVYRVLSSFKTKLIQTSDSNMCIRHMVFSSEFGSCWSKLNIRARPKSVFFGSSPHVPQLPLESCSPGPR